MDGRDPGALTGGPPATVTLLGGSVRQRDWVAVKAAVGPSRTLVCAVPDTACLGAAAWAGAALGLDPAALVCERREVRAAAGPAAAYRRAHHATFLPAVTATSL
ncbi:hypothetical protein NKH77_04715 [Streptomyces sp. M19]